MQQLADLIASCSGVIHIEENTVDFKAKLKIARPFEDACNAWLNAISCISKRDTYELMFSIPGERKSTDGSTDSLIEVKKFINDCASEDEMEISLVIRKKVVSHYISVYSIHHFEQYFESNLLVNILSSVTKIFDHHLCFEVFSSISHFGSNTISFQSSEESEVNTTFIISDEARKAKLLMFRENCLAGDYESLAKGMLPSDFYLDKKSNFSSIDKVFNALSIVLGVAFLANTSEYRSDDKFSYKIYGYKSIVGSLTGLEADSFDSKTINQIYEWAYEGGNGSDKLGLIRNLVSIHLDSSGQVIIDASLKDAILSNYQIYLKGNIQSYLEVKSKIAELLVQFAEKTASITDDLLGSLKSNVAIIVTFLLTVVVVNGLKDNGEMLIFSNIYLYVVVIITLISGLWLWMLRKNIARRFESMATSIERTIISNYKNILLEEEINAVVTPSIMASRTFLVSEVKSYTKLWTVLLLVFIVLYMLGNVFIVEESTVKAFFKWLVTILSNVCVCFYCSYRGITN